MAWGPGWGEPWVKLQIARSETKQDRNSCLAREAKEKIREGAILLFQQTLAGGEGGRYASEAAPRPEPWSLDAGVGVSPAATEPHLSPQEHRVLTNPTLSPFPRGARGLEGYWDTLAGHGKPLWPQPTIQISRCRQTRDVVPANCGGSTTWGSAWAQGDRRPAGCSVLGPLASCCPSPSSGHGHPAPSLPRLQEAAWHRSRPPSAALLCVCACH